MICVLLRMYLLNQDHLDPGGNTYTHDRLLCKKHSKFTQGTVLSQNSPPASKLPAGQTANHTSLILVTIQFASQSLGLWGNLRLRENLFYTTTYKWLNSPQIQLRCAGTSIFKQERVNNRPSMMHTHSYDHAFNINYMLPVEYICMQLSEM